MQQKRNSDIRNINCAIKAYVTFLLSAPKSLLPTQTVLFKNICKNKRKNLA